MQFLHVQLQYTNEQLMLHIQTHLSIKYFQLEAAVSDPEEFAKQVELFVGIQVRPYFDMLPVESCEITIAPEVPRLVQDRCLSEFIKLSRTNELLMQLSADDHFSEPAPTKIDQKLIVYSEKMPLEGLMYAHNATSSTTLTVGYLPTQEPTTPFEMSFRRFRVDLGEWTRWIDSLELTALLCAQDFVADFERQGIVLSTVLGFLDCELVIFEAEYKPGQVMRYFDQRACDSSSITRYVQDEKSLQWGRWLGLQNVQLGPLRHTGLDFDPAQVIDGFRQNTVAQIQSKPRQVTNWSQDHTAEPSSALFICEDLHLRRLLAWLPQAYFIKGLLDQQMTPALTGVLKTDIWLSVMRRLLVASAQSSDYDVVVLVRRLELIANAVHNLQIIDFCQQLDTKTQFQIAGHPEWQRFFPNQYVDGYMAHEWQTAMQQRPESMLVSFAPVFHPSLLRRCMESVATGMPSAFFSSYHYLCQDSQLSSDPGLKWLGQHTVISPDGLCVHAVSSANHHGHMIDTRQKTVDLLDRHNNNFASDSELSLVIDGQLDSWNAAVEQFYLEHEQIFSESLLALNPLCDLGITESLRVSPPAYLEVLLSMLDSKVAATG